MAVAQLGQHFICGRLAESKAAKVSDNLRLPSAIHAPPTIALETEDPQSAVVRIVSALSAGTPTIIMFTLSCATVLFAGPARC